MTHTTKPQTRCRLRREKAGVPPKAVAERLRHAAIGGTVRVCGALDSAPVHCEHVRQRVKCGGGAVDT